jgi:hypothetical protein
MERLSLATLMVLDEAESKLLAPPSAEASATDVRSASAEGASLLAYFAWALAIGPIAIGVMSMVPRPQLLFVTSTPALSWSQGTVGQVGLPDALTQRSAQVERSPGFEAPPLALGRSRTEIRLARPDSAATSTSEIEAEVDVAKPNKADQTPAADEIPARLNAPSNLVVR